MSIQDLRLWPNREQLPITIVEPPSSYRLAETPSGQLILARPASSHHTVGTLLHINHVPDLPRLQVELAQPGEAPVQLLLQPRWAVEATGESTLSRWIVLELPKDAAACTQITLRPELTSNEDVTKSEILETLPLDKWPTVLPALRIGSEVYELNQRPQL